MILGAIGFFMAASGFANSILGLFPPLSTAYSKFAYSLWPNMVPGLGDLIQAYYREEITEGEYQKAAEQQGFGSTWSMRLYESGKQLITAADYVALWRRGHIDNSLLEKRLKHLRFSDESITDIKNATVFFPQPQDLVRFAVREVYSPATVEKFGQMEDLPVEFITEAAKAGLPAEQAGNYWASHWDLPGVNQAFEMFQRDVIDADTLSMLLKALDIMPYWRDQLTQIAYNPLTRVDIRRMHAMGVLSDTQTYDAYRYQGNSPVNADLMLKFTKRYNTGVEKEASRGVLINAYNIDLISSGSLQQQLIRMGDSVESAVYTVSIAEYKKDLAAIDDLKKEYEAQVLLGHISIETYGDRLNEMALPATYVDAALRRVELKTADKVKLPSKADLERWLSLQVIDEKQYVSQMRTLNYRQGDIENYLTEIALVQDTTVRKYVSIGTYVRWLTVDIINETTFRTILEDQNISNADINRYLVEVEAARAELTG